LLLIGSFFEDKIMLWRLSIPKRLLTSLLVVVFIKIAIAVLLFYWMDIESVGTFWFDANRVFIEEQNQALFQITNSTVKWPYLFVGWDSAWYLSIMTKGYMFSSQSHAFSPGLPLIGAIFNLALDDPLVSLVSPNLIFGVLWVPFYQLLAEGYMDKRAALASTLLFALSPYTLIFTTVAYSEGLLLFFSISAYYLLKIGKIGWASGLAAFAALTRITGVLIFLPMFIFALKKKNSLRIRYVMLSFLPIAVVVFWFSYFHFLVGDFFAPVHTTEWSELHTVPNLLFDNFPQKGLHNFSELLATGWPEMHYWIIPIATACALFIPLILIRETAKIDKALAVYSLAGYIGVLCFGALVSMPRFISMLFPLWLPLTVKSTWNKKTIWIFTLSLICSLILSVDMWRSFLDGQFIA